MSYSRYDLVAYFSRAFQPTSARDSLAAVNVFVLGSHAKNIHQQKERSSLSGKQNPVYRIFFDSCANRKCLLRETARSYVTQYRGFRSRGYATSRLLAFLA
jgi:hypothetical protein